MKHVLILPMLVLLCSSCGKTPTQTSNNPEFPITGAEVWTVSGTNYNIEGTALLVMGNGQTLFVVKALTDHNPDGSQQPVARCLAKYAVDHGYHKRAISSWGNGRPQPFSGAVGVALIHKTGLGPSSVSYGYRYSFTVAELSGSKAQTIESTSDPLSLMVHPGKI